MRKQWKLRIQLKDFQTNEMPIFCHICHIPSTQEKLRKLFRVQAESTQNDGRGGWRRE